MSVSAQILGVCVRFRVWLPCVALPRPQVGADWWFSNLHKWAFAPPTAAVLVARDASLLADTHHAVPSWAYPKGLDHGAR